MFVDYTPGLEYYSQVQNSNTKDMLSIRSAFIFLKLALQKSLCRPTIMIQTFKKKFVSYKSRPRNLANYFSTVPFVLAWQSKQAKYLALCCWLDPNLKWDIISTMNVKTSGYLRSPASKVFNQVAQILSDNLFNQPI